MLIVQVSFIPVIFFVLRVHFFGGWRHAAAARASPLAISRPAGNSGKKRGDDTCAFKNSTWDVKELFSERRRTPNFGRIQTRRGVVPCREVDGVGPNFPPGDRLVVEERSPAIMSVPSLPVFWLHFLQTNTQEKRLLGRKRNSESKEKWPKPGPRKRRKTWWGTLGNKWFDDRRTTPEVKKPKYWHNQTVVR